MIMMSNTLRSNVFENRLSRVIEQFSSAQSEEAESGSGAIAYLRDSVVSILQNGPQCGLVTLQMAATSLRLPAVDVEHILKIAQQKGFTSRGEMFSVEWLYELAVSIWPALRGVVRDLPKAEELCELLRADSAVLIPYDCDKNNEPVILHGDCAHWCIVVGYLCRDVSRTELEWSKANASQADYEHMHVFCLHGKSRHLAIWKYADLVESNANLNEFAKRRLLDGESYILPSEGVRALKQKCLLLSL